MKILRFERKIEDALPPFREVPGGGIPVGLIADSAINRNRHPVFIPDFAAEGWILDILPAIRISRLGKFIAPRFADRYIDALTLCALLRPRVNDATPSSPGFFDCALTIGEFRCYNKEEQLSIRVESEPLKGAQGETGVSEIAIPAAALQAEELIARASIYCTLKSGDLILPGTLGLTLPATFNHSLRATINDLPSLSTRLK